MHKIHESETKRESEQKRRKKNTIIYSAFESESGSEHEDARNIKRTKTDISFHPESEIESDSDARKIKRKRR